MTGVNFGRLRLLGGFQLEVANAAVSLPANGQRLLAFLGIRGGSPRSLVAGTLWPEVTEHNAQGSLRTTMWRLHRRRPDLVVARDERLALSAAVAVDSRELARAAIAMIRRGAGSDDTGAGLHAGSGADPADYRDDDPADHRDDPADHRDGDPGDYADGDSSEDDSAVSLLLDGGELLPGWYDDWVIFERERLRQLRLHALEVSAQRIAARGDYARALQLVLEAAQTEPLRESAHRIVIAIHLAEGNVYEALRHYAFVRDLLLAELGIAPSEQLTAMLPGEVRPYEPDGRSGARQSWRRAQLIRNAT